MEKKEIIENLKEAILIESSKDSEIELRNLICYIEIDFIVNSKIIYLENTLLKVYSKTSDKKFIDTFNSLNFL